MLVRKLPARLTFLLVELDVGEYLGNNEQWNTIGEASHNVTRLCLRKIKKTGSRDACQWMVVALETNCCKPPTLSLRYLEVLEVLVPSSSFSRQMQGPKKGAWETDLEFAEDQ